MGNALDSIFGGSESKSTSTTSPKDFTPQEFANLRPGIAGTIREGIQQGGGQYGGQFTSGLHGNEWDLLNQIQSQAMNQGQGGAGQASQQFLQNLISGQGQGVPAQVQAPEMQSIGQFQTPEMQQLTGLRDIQGIQGGTTMAQTNPFLQGAIEAQQRGVIEQFNEETLPGLRAQFAQAGQQIQDQGSSPFAVAQARASSGLANALGDIGTNLAAQDFAQRQQLASSEFQQLRDLMTQQELTGRSQQLEQMLTGRGQDIQAGLTSRDQMLEQMLTGRGQDLEAGLTQRGQDIDAQQNLTQQQLQGVETAAGLEQAQLDNLMASLEAQALPRLVEQYGIDQGLSEFRRRQDQLLSLLNVAGGLSSPTISSVTTQRSTQEGANPFGQAIGAGIGTYLGGM